MSLLEVRGLRKQYGSRVVVNGVDLDVNAGEIVGLLGPNGAGKTTTFRMVVGMIAPKAGKVTFANQDVTHAPMYQRARFGLGYLAQDSSVFRRLTVEQNLFAILELMTTRRGQPFRSSSAQRRAKVDELLGQFGLERLRKSMASNLSGGERRRLEIARCLVSEPMLIMLDEPFTGIDPRTIDDIQQTIGSLRSNGIGVLVTDHQVDRTLQIADRTYVIADGKVISHGTSIEVVNDAHVRQVYLGENIHIAGIANAAQQRAQSPASVRSLLDDQAITEALAHVRTAEPVVLAGRLRPRARLSAQRLLEMMESSDPVLRERAHRVLCELLATRFVFEPGASEPIRIQQTHRIRAYLDQRLAG